MKKKWVIGIIIIFQILIILIIIHWLVIKRSTSQYIVSPIKDNLTKINQTTDLKHFYTLSPNTVNIDTDSWLPEQATQTITSQGFNERYVYATQTPNNTLRIITLGNSFTYGMYINTADNYPEKLEDDLNLMCSQRKFEVINGGVIGYDATYAMKLYTSRMEVFKPKIVVWLINQGLGSINEIQIPINNECANNTAPEVYNKINLDGSVSHPCSELTNTSLKERMSLEEIIDYHNPVFKKMIRDTDTQWLLLTLRYEKSLIKEILQDLDEKFPHIHYAEISSDLSSHSENVLPDSHPNKIGHEKIAKEIKNILINKNLLSCNNE